MISLDQPRTAQAISQERLLEVTKPGSIAGPIPSQGLTPRCVYLLNAEPVCVVRQPETEGSEHISSVRIVSAGELRRMIAESEIIPRPVTGAFRAEGGQGFALIQIIASSPSPNLPHVARYPQKSLFCS